MIKIDDQVISKHKTKAKNYKGKYYLTYLLHKKIKKIF